jgi:mRNA-degrading endonuclease RelE of RelBE toxin-antitoxin system
MSRDVGRCLPNDPEPFDDVGQRLPNEPGLSGDVGRWLPNDPGPSFDVGQWLPNEPGSSVDVGERLPNDPGPPRDRLCEKVGEAPDDAGARAELRRELLEILKSDPGLAASLQGSGAIGQAGGVAAGQGGWAAGRDIVVNYGQPAPADPAPLREIWLQRMASETESLALSGIDPALAHDREARLRLDAVYTALRIRSVASGYTRRPPSALGRGKRGGVRVIYFWHGASETVLMLFVYPKNEQENLTPDQRRALRLVIERECP